MLKLSWLLMPSKLALGAGMAVVPTSVWTALVPAKPLLSTLISDRSRCATTDASVSGATRFAARLRRVGDRSMATASVKWGLRALSVGAAATAGTGMLHAKVSMA